MELSILHSVIGEVWKPIKGFPNYVVSNRGRVYSLSRLRYDKPNYNKKGKFLIPRLGKQGYLYVGLCKNGKVTTKKVHRLVAEAFLPNEKSYECVNHRDECRTNNSVENLEWCTTQQNVTYGRAIQKRQHRLIESGWYKCVEQYDKSGNFIARFSSIAEAARNSICSKAGICACCRGTRNSDNGFIWKYGKETPC